MVFSQNFCWMEPKLCQWNIEYRFLQNLRYFSSKQVEFQWYFGLRKYLNGGIFVFRNIKRKRLGILLLHTRIQLCESYRYLFLQIRTVTLKSLLNNDVRKGKNNNFYYSHLQNINIIIFLLDLIIFCGFNMSILYFKFMSNHYLLYVPYLYHP